MVFVFLIVVMVLLALSFLLAAGLTFLFCALSGGTFSWLLALGMWAFISILNLAFTNGGGHGDKTDH